MPEPVIAYVDGFNFYHGLMDKGWGRFRWLDFPALISRFILDDQELVRLKYFTAWMNHQPDKLSRQRMYMKALEKHGAGVDSVHGEFESRNVRCAKCGEWYTRPQEKRTDVNLAVHLVADAFDDAFSTAILVCADADLVPAVRFVKERFAKRVVLIDPPRRHSTELAEIADRHLHLHSSQLSQSQFPNPVVYEPRPGRTRRIYRPSGWDSN